MLLKKKKDYSVLLEMADDFTHDLERQDKLGRQHRQVTNKGISTQQDCCLAKQTDVVEEEEPINDGEL